MPDPTGWVLDGFLERLDEWCDRERPDADMRIVVTAWIFTRADEPYRNVRREKGFANLWFGPIPGTVDDDATVVTCSYWIEESTRTLRCNSFATLSLPL